MSQTIKDFDFSQLTAAERILLAQELWDSVHEEAVTPPLSPVQRDDMKRRWRELESGEVQGLSWEQVRTSLLSGR